MEQTGLGRTEAETVRALTVQTVEDFQERQRAQLQDILGELGGMIRAELDKLSPAQKAITYGILADKLATQPKALTQNLHLHIKGDASSALASILGPAAQSVFSHPSRQDSKDPNYFPPGKPGPVIDLAASDASDGNAKLTPPKQ
jgi:nucleotidyltransferase/DNA polymerase involved in DNA repair